MTATRRVGDRSVTGQGDTSAPVTDASTSVSSPKPLLRHALLGLFGCLAFLPVASWLPGGGTAPGYSALLLRWLSGTAVVLLLAGLATALERGAGTRVDTLMAHLRRIAAHSAAPYLMAALACGMSTIVAHSVFSGRPLHVDAITQAYQATVFASGRLSVPTPEHLEFSSSFLIADIGGRSFSQFPPGWPALLALGVQLGVAWLVGPLLVGAAVLSLYALARGLELSPGQALAAAAAFGCAPWVLVTSASWMNHLPALAFLLAGAAALVHARRRLAHEVRLSVAAGLALGISLTIRPIDAIVFLVPALCWVGWSGWQARRLAPLVGLGGGLLPPLLALLWYNGQTTGHALQLGYEALWGPAHRLGFHTDPWGTAHTLVRGLANVNGYLLDMQGELLASAMPGLLFCLVALALVRRIGTPDRWLIAGAVLLLTVYVAYWHRGDFLGPRFLFALAPLAMLWTVRLPTLVAARWHRPAVTAIARWSVVLAVGSGLLFGWPPRWRAYHDYAPARRWDGDSTAAAAGLTDALILIREPWGAQVIARLWGRGVPHSEAQQLYQQVDTCLLYLTIQDLERSEVTGTAAVAELRPLRRDSAAVATMAGAADSTLRMRPGLGQPGICRRRLREDRMGTQPFAPFLLSGAGGNQFARDLQERNTLLLRTFPGRRVYQMRLTRDAGGATRRTFVPVRPDSALASWRQDAEGGGLAALRESSTGGSPPLR